MRELRITLKLGEWELIPTYNKNGRAIKFRWLFIDAYVLKNKK